MQRTSIGEFFKDLKNRILRIIDDAMNYKRKEHKRKLMMKLSEAEHLELKRYDGWTALGNNKVSPRHRRLRLRKNREIRIRKQKSSPNA